MSSYWHPIRRVRKFLEEMKDRRLNRELVGVDRFGNKYYQYYSPYGLPTRREVSEWKKKKKNITKILIIYLKM